MLELKNHRDLTSIRVAVKLGGLRRSTPSLTDGQEIAFAKGVGCHLPDVLMKPCSIARYLSVRLLGNQIYDIKTEAANALVHPPEYHIIQFFSELRVIPVKVRLLYRKLVQIVLPKLWYPFPRRTAKCRCHIIRRNPFLAITPHIIVMIRIVLAFLRLNKPPVLIWGMIEHHIHYNLYITLSRLSNQLLHIRK